MIPIGDRLSEAAMTKPRKRLLLTGPSGLLGAAIVDHWGQRWDITALVGRHRMARGVVDNVPADLRLPDGLAALVERHRPDVVVHCAAWTDLDACEANPELARTLHRDASAALAEGAARAGARFVYISTDSLFSAVPGPHREEDPIDPRSVYARTKWEGEQAALSACPSSLILRTCIVGWNAQPKVSLAEWMLRELRAERPVKAFVDVWFTPILTTTLAAAIEKLLTVGAAGVLHVGGGECVTKHAFAEQVAAAFELPASLIIPTSIAGVPLRAPRPASPCLDSSRYAALTGEPLQRVGDLLREMRLQESSGWVTSLRSSIAAD